MTVGNATTTDLVRPVGAGRRRRPAATRPPRVGAAPSRATAIVILAVTALVFLVPIAAMLEFSFRQGQRVDGVQRYSLQHYAALLDPANAYTYQDLFDGIANSLVICVVTVAIVLVLLVPAMILVELRYPRLRRALEFVCIVPITIPSIVLVVGFVPVYSVVAQLVGSVPWTLALAVGIIVLPYAYRPIAANMAGVELAVLSEASRSLGAGWGATLWRVILPNLRRGILSACFITVAMVLGEYTIASFLSQDTFQTALVLINHTDSYVSVIFAVLALLFGFVLLFVIGRIGAAGVRRDRRTRESA